MSSYRAEVIWTRDGQVFTDRRYRRSHRLRFDGGIEIAGSSSPQVVPLPFSCEHAVDPEEAFVAALASCHMLWFLSLAAERGFRVDRYHDVAEGVMGRNANGKLAIVRVTLRPRVGFSGATQPTRIDLDQLHDDAHDECFIANSVRTEVRCEPQFDAPDAVSGDAR